MWQGMATIYNWRDFIASAANFPLTIPDSFSPQIFTDSYITAINPTQVAVSLSMITTSVFTQGEHYWILYWLDFAVYLDVPVKSYTEFYRFLYVKGNIHSKTDGPTCVSKRLAAAIHRSSADSRIALCTSVWCRKNFPPFSQHKKCVVCTYCSTTMLITQKSGLLGFLSLLCSAFYLWFKKKHFGELQSWLYSNSYKDAHPKIEHLKVHPLTTAVFIAQSLAW